jgi:two-component system alkaline phosphatase synthesis response regulator PhoP
MNISSPHILLVDDESSTLDFLSYNLNKHGFKVYTSTNGEDAIKHALKIQPQLILLDIMMPEMDGIETCLELRKNTELDNTIIVFLSARKEDYTKIVGFNAGADDFIEKPVATNVLITRLKALLKRIPFKQDNEIIEINGLKIIRDKYLVIKNGIKFTLPKKEFELLYLLAANSQKVHSREEILQKVWGEDSLIGDRTINVHISRLRNRLKFPIIRTVKGIGYCIRLDG